ncbi:MAG: enolase C-terminal domain-like protein [Betaproteobacteria bacterium]
MIESLVARALEIPFKTSFAHASASREVTQSLWVEAGLRDGTRGFGEGCPREYVTGETMAGALAFVAEGKRSWLQDIRDVETLHDWTQAHVAAIDKNPAAWCAVELALLDALAKQAGRSAESLLGVPEISGRFRYTAVLGDSGAKRFEAELARYLQAGFRDFKIKLSGELGRDLDKVAVLKAAAIAPQAVRADANNLWREADDAIRFLACLDYGFGAIEEPLKAGDHAGMDRIAARSGCSIILDESLLRADQVATFADAPSQWIVNLRISKMGGLIRSLALLAHLRRAGLRVIVGAHVGETSLLTRAALTVANVARDILAAQEGAFGTHLLEHDVIDPPIMFGAGGLLDARQLPAGKGFGIVASNKVSG